MTNLEQQLYHTALTARQNAYAPYSKFFVGAAILTDSGQIFAGCNVENASYPCGACAETGAISAMVAGGERHIKAILILADTTCILPCGNCLQKIVEFGNAQTVIYSADLNGIQKVQTLADLLPQNFNAEDMKHA